MDCDHDYSDPDSDEPTYSPRSVRYHSDDQEYIPDPVALLDSDSDDSDEDIYEEDWEIYRVIFHQPRLAGDRAAHFVVYSLMTEILEQTIEMLSVVEPNGVTDHLIQDLHSRFVDFQTAANFCQPQ